MRLGTLGTLTTSGLLRQLQMMVECEISGGN
jgi:hypothetical protein